jgi:hypothetical protein
MDDEKSKKHPEFSSADNKDVLFHSISEINNIIRAVDTKLGFILTVILIPVSQYPKILDYYLSHCYSGSIFLSCIYGVIFSVLAVCWLLSLICGILGIGSIYDPSGRIKFREPKPSYQDSYFSGRQFPIILRDIFTPRNTVKSKRFFEEYVEDLPRTDSDKIKLLLFEKLKCAYIRDLKIKRQTWAFRFTLIWLLGGMLTFTAIKISGFNTTESHTGAQCDKKCCTFIKHEN